MINRGIPNRGFCCSGFSISIGEFISRYYGRQPEETFARAFHILTGRHCVHILLYPLIHPGTASLIMIATDRIITPVSRRLINPWAKYSCCDSCGI